MGGWFVLDPAPVIDFRSVLLGAATAAVAVTGASLVFLRASRNRMRRIVLIHDQILAHAAHAVISTDGEGTIQTLSPGAEELFGYKTAELAGRANATLLVDAEELYRRGEQMGDGVAPFVLLVAASRPGGTIDQREWTCRKASGASFPARVFVTALDEGGGYVLVVSDNTPLQAAQRDRQEYGTRLAKVASQVPGMVFQMRRLPNGRLSLPYASDGMREVFGVEPGVAANDLAPLLSRVHEQDRLRVATSVRAATAAGESWHCEFRAHDTNGKVHWLWANTLVEKQPNGTLLWFGFLADITERVTAESAHEENRKLLHSILSSVDLGVFLVDVLPGGNFRFVEVNPAYERLTGITGAEIRGRTPQELVPVIPPEMASCLAASFRRAADAPGPVEYEEPFFVRGRLLWWLTRFTPLRDSSGQVVRLVGRSLDITERKAVELRVQSLTERLQLATEAAQVGVWDFDVQQNRLVCDERMMALYGLDGANFGGNLATWRDRVHGEDRTRVEQEFRDALEGQRAFNTSFRIVRPDGGERQVCARGHVQRNPAGRAVRMVAVHWDVTAERRAQAEIESARDRAEGLNRQLEDALERAHRLAQEASAATVAKSEFLANMSHEIRTPLNAIIGMSGLLLGTEMSKEQREFAETIRSSGDGLLGLVNDILDYSKIESGRLELETRPFDLRVCVETAIDVLSARATEKRLDLVYAIDGGVPECINGDVVRLRQVIVNLLSNAVKFTSRGEVFLAVNTVPAQDTGRVRLRFAVHDSGIGIPADRMDRLFKTFSQVDASTTRQYGGTGLGLAISKRIIELMEGRIWVESTAGKGSTFCFEIETTSAMAPTKPYASGRVAGFTGRRLLVVDDNATTCRVLCQQAVTWGMVPRAVASGIEALTLVQRGERFDLVLVDHELGGTPTTELVKQLRQVPGGADAPIALMTLPGFIRPAEMPGVKGTISKPLRTGPLYELFSEMLQGRAAATAATVVSPPAETRPLSILLAEDNPVNQRVAILMLQRLGYRPDVAANGREAVEAALRQRYDLILMDVQMPEMDGIQATREIFATAKAGVVPRIVAMTANASVTDRDRCLQAGMSDFLTKPVRADDLRRAIEETPARNQTAGIA